jgi:hypothetical protein
LRHGGGNRRCAKAQLEAQKPARKRGCRKVELSEHHKFMRDPRNDLARRSGCQTRKMYEVHVVQEVLRYDGNMMGI